MILDSVYNEISARLTLKLNTQFAVSGFGKLAYVDVFNDQFTELALGEEIAIDFPAILIEFSDIEYTQQGKNAQQGVTLIRFHVGQNLLDYKDKRGKALAYLDFVHNALQGFMGERFNGLMRLRTTLDISGGNLFVHVMEYTTAVWDNSADKTLNMAQVQAGLDEQYSNPLQ